MMQADWPATVASVSVNALTPDGGTLILELTPEDLGRLRVTLTIEGDTASVRFQTETPEAARLLTDAEKQLSAEFARSGVTLTGHEARSDTSAGGKGTRSDRTADQTGPQDDAPHADSVPLPRAGVINLIA
jgi:flagellar hook-length control protein FliK